VAWNGVRFLAPACWEVTRIGPRYLLLADEEGATLEIKWRRVQGGFSHQRAFKRLRSLHQGRVQECPLPAEWDTLLPHFTVRGFAWQAEAQGGQGAVLYCPACGNATLIQFFRKAAQRCRETCRRVLASFRDHSGDDQVRWSIFDIRAEIPAEYRLVRYRFEAGRFEMHFGANRQQIALYRWGPASALLANGDLSAFAAQTIRIQSSEWHPVNWRYPAVQWEKPIPSGFWTRCRERITGTPHFQWFRLWHLGHENRILGMGARGDQAHPSESLDRLCSHYESL
jgi:hypothetical protein